MILSVETRSLALSNERLRLVNKVAQRLGVAGTCKYGDEPSGSKNAENFLTSYRIS